MKKREGKVFLVGAGPGDPGLITVRGRELLRRADVVVVDALVDNTVLKGLRARIVYVGKRGPGAPHGSSLSLPQETINKLLVKLGKQGHQVVRLKGGDPFVFGRGNEELDALEKAGVASVVIPGVTSAVAAPAVAGIPITDRRWASQVTFITGHGQAETRGADPLSPKIDWKRLSPKGTLVILMGVASWPKIRRKLLAMGWPLAKPVTAIESGTNLDQRILRSSLAESQNDFKQSQLIAPAVIVVGEVAKLGKKRKRVVITRPSEQSLELVSSLQARGVEIISAPSIRIVPLKKKLKLQRSSYDWILFLSANAVRNFHADKLKRSPVLTVGHETKRVAESYGWKVQRVPRQFTSQGVLSVLGAVRRKFILIPRVQNAPKDLPLLLRARGANVEELATYETQDAKISQEAKNAILKGIDVVTFTSASTVRGFFSNFKSVEVKQIFKKAIAISMGPQTTAALKSMGVSRLAEAKNSTIPELIKAIHL